MAEYEHVTRFIDILESSTADEAKVVLQRDLSKAIYRSKILDMGYIGSVSHAEAMDVRCGKFKAANIEAIGRKEAIRLLTLIMYSEQLLHGALWSAYEDGLLLRILRRIAELDGTWKRPTLITFHHEYDRDGYLSNWYDAPFRFRRITFPTVDHWMMWQKARVFGDWEMRDEIAGERDLDIVRKLGRQVRSFDDKTWGEVRVPIMRYGLRLKFSQNKRLMNDLLSTGTAVLAEAAPNDMVWGIGFGTKDPRSKKPDEWRGRNLLGITLMELRSDLRALELTGEIDWPVGFLFDSHVWKMSLLELARIPSTRPVALMYAAIVAQQVPDRFKTTRDVLRKVDASIEEINETTVMNIGGVLPFVGCVELIDELEFQVRLGRI